MVQRVEEIVREGIIELQSQETGLAGDAAQEATFVVEIERLKVYEPDN